MPSVPQLLSSAQAKCAQLLFNKLKRSSRAVNAAARRSTSATEHRDGSGLSQHCDASANTLGPATAACSPVPNCRAANARPKIVANVATAAAAPGMRSAPFCCICAYIASSISTPLAGVYSCARERAASGPTIRYRWCARSLNASATAAGTPRVRSSPTSNAWRLQNHSRLCCESSTGASTPAAASDSAASIAPSWSPVKDWLKRLTLIFQVSVSTVGSMKAISGSARRQLVYTTPTWA